jgi:aspartate beta-hydroxylase
VTIPGNEESGESPPAIPALANARSFAQAGRIAEAERDYKDVLAHHPDNVEALAFLAQCALSKGQPQEAVQALQRAHQLQANNPHILRNLGVAWDAVGDVAAAQHALEASVALAPDGFQTRLHLASVYERQGLTHEALVNYFRAIIGAQLVGRWMDIASTPHGLQAKVIHAMNVVEHGRTRLFNECLAPLRAHFGPVEIQRVQHWLNEYLAFRSPSSPDPRQKPKFMYMPGLPSQPYYDRSLFPFIEGIEDIVAVMREEMLENLDRSSGFVPFLGIDDASQLQGYLENANGRPAWDAFFFYRHGSPVQENQQKCPLTASMLENLPLVRIRDHAPEICFSVLTPGTHILPHYGVTNTRLVLHLPLVVPENCNLVVGGEIHAWREARCVVFDDTYLHEAWNRGPSNRVVLIMDVWNPHLTEVERLAITELVGVIGDFNRASGT